MPVLIIVDDHESFRKELASALAVLLPGRPIRDIASLDELPASLAGDSEGGVVLVELRASVSATVSKLVRLRMAHPRLRFALMAGRVGRREMMDTSAAGLLGIVSKAHPVQEVATAVATMLEGSVDPSRATASVPQRDLGRPPAALETAGLDTAKLTQRQRQVLTLLAQGFSNKEIARRLSIAEPTAKIHVAALMRILGARNRVEVAGLARTLPEIVG